MKRIVYFAGLSLALLNVSCGHFDEITPRSYVSLLFGDTKSVREEIGKSLSKGDALHSAGALTIRPRNGNLMAAPIDFGWVTAQGAIVVHNKKYGVIVIQEPTLSQSGVTWRCVVYPVEAKPNVCDL